MPVFTAIAAAVTAFTGFTFLGSVAAFAAKAVLFNGVSKLIGNRQGGNAAGSSNAGARVQIPPATDNKLPVIYGSAFVAPTITDAKLTTDQKSMYYVCTLAEVTNTMAGQTPNVYTFDKIFYGGKEVTFGSGADAAKVVSLTTNSDPVQVDTTINGNMWIYLFPNGSSSGTNTGGASAIDILSDSGIPADQRWNSAFYTDGGDSASMTNTAFMIVKLNYNQDAGTTGLDQLTVQLTNPLKAPGAVLYDYMYNNVYGCGIPSAQIDTASLTALDVYSAQQITYNPVSGPPTTQDRYQINGPLNTGNNCLSNLQQLVDACDSWLQYSELTGKWKVVINKAYTGATTSLYHVNSDVLIGGIDINPIDLNETYNSLEVQYPNANIKDQTDFRVIDLTDPSSPWYDPTLLSYNEPDNRLVIQYGQVNNYVQAVYLGVRRLLQSREDLTINFMLDYSGIQIEAGDVIRVTLEEYGWDAPTFPDGKLFRVSQVQEAKLEDGTLGARIVAFEYNDSVYADNAINDFVPETNTGLSDPNIISAPGTPVLTVNPLSNGNVKSFNVQATVPTTGSVLYMDFNYGYTSDVSTHILYKTVSSGNGAPFTAGETIRIDVNDAPPGTYYVSIAARNNNAGKLGASSAPFTWTGPGVTVYDPVANAGGISGDNVNGNIDLTGNILYSGANFTFSNIDHLHIPGGTYAYYLQTDGTGNLSWGTGGNGIDNPGGANRAIQFNDEGNLGGVANFTWDKVTEIQRVPVIQLSNGAEKITTLASNGNLYLTGWENPANMAGISLFQGAYFNGNNPVLGPGLAAGSVTLDITNIPNISATTSAPYTTTNTATTNYNTSLTNPISFGGNFIIASNVSNNANGGGQVANGIYSSNSGISWTRVANAPTQRPYWLVTDGANLVVAGSGPTGSFSRGNLSTWNVTGTIFNSPANYTVSTSYATNGILYANNKFLSYNIGTSTSGPFNYKFSVSTSVDGGNNWGNTITLNANVTSQDWYTSQVFVSGNTFVTYEKPAFPYDTNNTYTRTFAYSSDGITWVYNTLPSWFANSANGYPQVRNFWTSSSLCGAYMLDRNSANTSQYEFYVATTTNFGNSWSTANSGYNANAIDVGRTIVSYQDNRLLSLYKSNGNANSTVVSVYATNNSVDFSFVGNVTVGNTVGVNKSLFAGYNGKLLLANAYQDSFPGTGAPISNVQHAIVNIPTISTYNTDGNFNSVVQDGTYQSLGGSQGGNTSLFIKTS